MRSRFPNRMIYRRGDAVIIDNSQATGDVVDFSDVIAEADAKGAAANPKAGHSKDRAVGRFRALRKAKEIVAA